jgi:tRNA pseudouridine55 synthase
MINLKQIEQAMQWFISNNYYQIPHKFSAIKINGKKAYEYARQNISIKLPSRLVKINAYKIINFDFKKQELVIQITVSKGFYVRSFAQDLAKKLHTYGHITSLRRLMIGNLSINNAITLEKYLEIYGKNK